MSILQSKAPFAARMALGTIFFVFGLNGFLHFIPQPPPPPAALAFAGALFQTGYMFPLIKGTEVLASLMLLSGRYVPLALTLLAPIVVNIVAFHVFLAPGAGPIMIAFTVLALGIYLAWSERAIFRPFFQTRRADAPASDRARGAGAHAAT